MKLLKNNARMKLKFLREAEEVLRRRDEKTRKTIDTANRKVLPRGLVCLLIESGIKHIYDSEDTDTEVSYKIKRYRAKSRKYQGVFEVKSRVKTWQVGGIWSQ